MSTRARSGVRPDGVWLDRADDLAVDVLFDGQRVWSPNPRRDARREHGGWHLRWPAPLRPHLTGASTVIVREHVSERVLLEDEVRFDASDARVRIADRAGHPLAISKTGHLNRSFGEREPALINALMDSAQAALALLKPEVPAFLAFGGLLGAVREGRLIGHDVDLDLGYLSAETHPVDAARESYRLQRLFASAGWSTWRYSANDFKVRAVGVNSAARWIDIFGGFVCDGTFYLMPNVAVPVERVQLLPLGTVVLEGRAITAPAVPQTLLEATYGPGWPTPDPSFSFRPPRSAVRRFDGWMRNAIAHRGHWFPYYSSAAGRAAPKEPSDFARWLAARLVDDDLVVDVGCGAGRDALWLARKHARVLGLDYAPSAINLAAARAKRAKSSATFEVFNLEDARQVLARGASLRYESERIAMSGRFLLDTLSDHARTNLWRFAEICLRDRGRLYLEFHVDDQIGAQTGSPRHVRLLDADDIEAEIVARGGRIVHREHPAAADESSGTGRPVVRLEVAWS